MDPTVPYGMLSGIVNPQYQPWFSLDGLRRYAAAREGMSPAFRARGSASFGDRYSGSPAAPSNAPISAPLVPTGGGDSYYYPGSEGMPTVPAAPVDPYAGYDEARRNRLGPQAPLAFGGMLNNDPSSPAFGMLNTPRVASAAAPATATTAAGLGDELGGAGLGGDVTGRAYTPAPQAAVPATPADQIPAAARPTQAAAQRPGEGFLSRISEVLNNNPSTLLALGAGFSGARNFGEGMSRAFAAAVPAVRQDQALTMQRQGISGTYAALVGAGATPSEALAAAYNPEVLKAMTTRLFGQSAHWGITGHDEYGNPKYGFINDNLQTVVEGNKVTIPRVSTPEDVLRLPRGQHFIAWDGHEYVR